MALPIIYDENEDILLSNKRRYDTFIETAQRSGYRRHHTSKRTGSCSKERYYIRQYSGRFGNGFIAVSFYRPGAVNATYYIKG